VAGLPQGAVEVGEEELVSELIDGEVEVQRGRQQRADRSPGPAEARQPPDERAEDQRDRQVLTAEQRQGPGGGRAEARPVAEDS